MMARHAHTSRQTRPDAARTGRRACDDRGTLTGSATGESRDQREVGRSRASASVNGGGQEQPEANEGLAANDGKGQTVDNATKISRALRGNRNSLRSGVHSFMLGRWPKGGQYVARCVYALRRQLEAAVMARGGEVGPYEAACIQTCCRWESRALLLQ